MKPLEDKNKYKVLGRVRYENRKRYSNSGCSKIDEYVCDFYSREDKRNTNSVKGITHLYTKPSL